MRGVGPLLFGLSGLACNASTNSTLPIDPQTCAPAASSSLDGEHCGDAPCHACADNVWTTTPMTGGCAGGKFDCSSDGGVPDRPFLIRSAPSHPTAGRMPRFRTENLNVRTRLQSSRGPSLASESRGEDARGRRVRFAGGRVRIRVLRLVGLVHSRLYDGRRRRCGQGRWRAQREGRSRKRRDEGRRLGRLGEGPGRWRDECHHQFGVQPILLRERRLLRVPERGRVRAMRVHLHARSEQRRGLRLPRRRLQRGQRTCTSAHSDEPLRRPVPRVRVRGGRAVQRPRALHTGLVLSGRRRQSLYVPQRLR